MGEVPDVNTIHEEPMAEPRRFGWLYGLAAILLVNAGGLAWWLWGTTSGPEPVAQAPVAPAMVTGQPVATLSTFQQADLQTSAPVATAPPTPQPVAEPVSPPQSPRLSSPSATQSASVQKQTLEQSAPPPVNPTAFVPVQKEIPPPPAPSEKEPSEDLAASGEEPLMEAEETLQVDEQGDEQGDEQVAEEEADGQVLVPIAVSSGSKERSKKAQREEEDPELAKIPFLKQLPLDVQQSLPALHISFHSYSIKPSARLVSISGKILRQGQDFDEDLKLEMITVKGVVFSFRGKRFRIDV